MIVNQFEGPAFLGSGFCIAVQIVVKFVQIKVPVAYY